MVGSSSVPIPAVLFLFCELLFSFSTGRAAIYQSQLISLKKASMPIRSLDVPIRVYHTVVDYHVACRSKTCGVETSRPAHIMLLTRGCDTEWICLFGILAGVWKTVVGMRCSMVCRCVALTSYLLLRASANGIKMRVRPCTGNLRPAVSDQTSVG